MQSLDAKIRLEFDYMFCQSAIIRLADGLSALPTRKGRETLLLRVVAQLEVAGQISSGLLLGASAQTQQKLQAIRAEIEESTTQSCRYALGLPRAADLAISGTPPAPAQPPGASL